MYTQVFPYANIIAGILILIVGFFFHWIGQLVSLFNWDLATRIGFAEKNMLPEFKVYELGIAAADVLIGWIYGVAGVGLILNASWAYTLAWFPGVIMIYHGLSVWFWMGNQNKLGHQLNTNTLRISSTSLNLVTGLLSVWVAW